MSTPITILRLTKSSIMNELYDFSHAYDIAGQSLRLNLKKAVKSEAFIEKVADLVKVFEIVNVAKVRNYANR